MKKQIDPLKVSIDYMKHATLSELFALERVLSCYKEIKQKERDEERQKYREYLRSRWIKLIVLALSVLILGLELYALNGIMTEWLLGAEDVLSVITVGTLFSIQKLL